MASIKMTCQWSWIQFLWVILPLTFAILVWVQLSKNKETFLSTDDTQTLIHTYSKILNRNPTATELAKHIKEIDRKEYTIHELEIRLYNSDEYKRLIKTQDNGLSPELSRMVEEKELIQYIRQIYTKERLKKPITNVLLPLRDLFVYLDYNPYKFVAMLRDSKYPDFEVEFLATKKLSKDTLLDIFKRTFNEFKIAEDAEAIRKTETIAPIGKKYKSTPKSSSGESTNLFGITDKDGSNLVSFLLEKGFTRVQNKMMADANGTVVNQDDVSSTQTTQSNSSISNGLTTSRYYLTPGKPPICVPVGEKHSVSPVVFGDLLGTTLAEAKDTQIGSIMPKFEYKEYIDVPNTCSTGTKIKTPPKKSAPKSYDVTPQASYSSTTVPSSSSSTTPPTTTTPPATTTPPTTTTPPATTTPPTTTTPPATTTPPKQYSQEVQKYKTLLDTANKALQDNTPTVTKSTFYEEMSLSKEPKVFFKKYPYMVDVLALYTYEKSAEFASINSTEKNNLYTDIEYWSRKYSIRVNENTYDHISTYLNLNSLRSFYVNNQTVIDDCLKNNSCLTNSTPSTNTSTTVEGFTNGTWYNYSKFF